MAGPWEQYTSEAPPEPVQDKKPWDQFANVLPQGNAGGVGRALAYGFSGGGIPFGNVITSGIGAGIANLAGAGDFKDLYDQAKADTKATQEEHPTATLVGNIAGIASTLPIGFKKTPPGGGGIGGGINAVAAKVGDFARGSKVAKDASMGAKALNLASRAGRGAIVAAPIGGLYAAGDADTGNRGQAFVDGALASGGIAAALPIAGAALGAGVSAALPKIDDGLREVGELAVKYKIPVSLDQLSTSRALKTAQKVSQDLPFSGQTGFRDKQMLSLNRELFKTVGIKADKFTPKTMDRAFSEVGKEFDDLGRGKVFSLNPLTQSIQEIAEDAKITSTADAMGNFRNAIERVYKNMDDAGNITGEKLNQLRSEINGLARKTSSNDTKELLLDLENALIETMTDADPAIAAAFSKTKQKYKNLLVLEPLAAKAKGGNISPTQLQNRVSKIYGRSFVRGQAGEIGDLARVGFELLPELGGSDTQSKMLYALGAGGGALANAPAVAAGLTANRALQSGVNRNPAVIKKLLSEKEIMKLPPAVAKTLLKGTP